jgi:outer membrane protein TolC
LAVIAGDGDAQVADTSGFASLAADTVLARLLPPALRASVLASAPVIVARRAELRAAEARWRATGFAPAAVLSVDLEDARGGRLDASSPRLAVSRDLLPGATRRALIATADADVRVARVVLAAAERQTIAQSARALYAASAWRAIARRLAAQDSLLSAAESAVRTRFSVGEARYVDVLRLRAERLRVQSDRAAAGTEADAALLSLAALAGDSAAANLAVTAADRAMPSAAGGPTGGEVVLPVVPSMESLVVIAADRQLADARLAQAAAERQLVLARQRPAASATIGLQRISPDGDRGAGLGPILAAGISLPFTARAANRAAEVAASERTAAAEIARTATITNTRARLAVGRARYESARRRLASFDAALLRGAREEREGALVAYRANDLSLIDLLDFERALSRVEIDRTRALLDALSALADLISGSASPDAIAASATARDNSPGQAFNDR